MSTTIPNREKALGMSPASVPLSALPTVELSNEQLQRINKLAQKRSESYKQIGGGVLFGSQDSLTSHEVGLLGELAVAQLYGISIDSEVYQRGDDGTDLMLRGMRIDVKTTATDAMKKPELLIRADKSLDADLYVRAHVIDYGDGSVCVRILGAASKSLVKDREPKRHPGTTLNFVVMPRELSLLPILQPR